MRASQLLLGAMALAVLSTGAGCGQLRRAAPAPQATAAPGTPAKKTYQDLVVGYAQIGAESEWRTANTLSVKETADQLGVELRFSDAQQKQDNQIKAIRS